MEGGPSCWASTAAKETVMRTPTALLTTAAVAVAGCATATADHRSTRAANDLPPSLPPASQFVRTVDNPWFPLEPGTDLTYKGNDEGTPATDVFRVTRRTKRILGIRATVIDDRVYHRGRLAERTNDWYAQDNAGNVWYLGEKTATLNAAGTVKSTEGTWRAGVDGARAGIFMPAQPRVHDSGWQEYYKGHAQDRYEILGLTTKIRTPAAASGTAMLTQ